MLLISFIGQKSLHFPNFLHNERFGIKNTLYLCCGLILLSSACYVPDNFNKCASASAQFVQSICSVPSDHSMRSMCGVKGVLQFAPAVRVSANWQFPKMNEKWKYYYFFFFLVAFSLLCYRDDVGEGLPSGFRILIFFNLYGILIEIITSV